MVIFTNLCSKSIKFLQPALLLSAEESYCNYCSYLFFKLCCKPCVQPSNGFISLYTATQPFPIEQSNVHWAWPNKIRPIITPLTILFNIVWPSYLSLPAECLWHHIRFSLICGDYKIVSGATPSLENTILHP